MELHGDEPTDFLHEPLRELPRRPTAVALVLAGEDIDLDGDLQDAENAQQFRDRRGTGEHGDGEDDSRSEALGVRPRNFATGRRLLPAGHNAVRLCTRLRAYPRE